MIYTKKGSLMIPAIQQPLNNLEAPQINISGERLPSVSLTLSNILKHPVYEEENRRVKKFFNLISKERFLFPDEDLDVTSCAVNAVVINGVFFRDNPDYLHLELANKGFQRGVEWRLDPSPGSGGPKVFVGVVDGFLALYLQRYKGESFREEMLQKLFFENGQRWFSAYFDTLTPRLKKLDKYVMRVSGKDVPVTYNYEKKQLNVDFNELTLSLCQSIIKEKAAEGKPYIFMFNWKCYSYYREMKKNVAHMFSVEMVFDENQKPQFYLIQGYVTHAHFVENFRRRRKPMDLDEVIDFLERFKGCVGLTFDRGGRVDLLELFGYLSDHIFPVETYLLDEQQGVIYSESLSINYLPFDQMKMIASIKTLTEMAGIVPFSDEEDCDEPLSARGAFEEEYPVFIEDSDVDTE